MLSPDPSKNSKLKSSKDQYCTQIKTLILYSFTVVAIRREEQQCRQHKEQERERVSEMLHEQKPGVVGELYHFLVTQYRIQIAVLRRLY